MNGKQKNDREKSMKPKDGSMRKINKIDKPLSRMIRKKRQTIQIHNISNKGGDIITDSTNLKRIIREYYLFNFFPKKCNNVYETNKFLETHKDKALEFKKKYIT